MITVQLSEAQAATIAAALSAYTERKELTWKDVDIATANGRQTMLTNVQATELKDIFMRASLGQSEPPQPPAPEHSNTPGGMRMRG